MKSMKVIKKVLGVLVLGALVSLLPMFAVDVKANGAAVPPVILKSDGKAAVEGTDYTIHENYLTLLKNDLTIKNPTGANTDFNITCECNDPELTYTLDNITFNGILDPRGALNFIDKKVTLKIKGECNIIDCCVGICGTDLTIVGCDDSTEDALNINISNDYTYENYGIKVYKFYQTAGGYEYVDDCKLTIGDTNNYIKVNIITKDECCSIMGDGVGGRNNTSHFVIKDKATVVCDNSNTNGTYAYAIDAFDFYKFEGTLEVKSNGVCIHPYGRISIGYSANILLTSKDSSNGTIDFTNTGDKALKESYLYVTGSADYNQSRNDTNRDTIIDGWGFATFADHSYPKTLYIRAAKLLYTVKFDSDGGNDFNDWPVLENNLRVVRPAEDPKKDGYTFEGWYDKNGNLFDFDSNIDPGLADSTGLITLKAKWKDNGNGNGNGNGNVSYDNETVTMNRKLSEVIKNAGKKEGKTVIYFNDYNGKDCLLRDTMKLLLDNPDVILVLDYTFFDANTNQNIHVHAVINHTIVSMILKEDVNYYGPACLSGFVQYYNELPDEIKNKNY